MFLGAWRDWSMRGKIAFVFTILVGVLAGVLYLILSNRLERQMYDTAASRSITIGAMASTDVGAGLYFHDEGSIDRAIASIVANRDIVYAVIQNDSGGIVGSVYEERALAMDYATPGRKSSLSEDGRTFQTSVPVRMYDQQVGEIFLGLSLDEDLKDLDRMKQIFGLVCAAIFAVGLLGVISISSVVTRPLGNLVTVVEEIAQGDLTKRVAVARGSELKTLAEAINGLLRTVEERSVDLQREMQHRKHIEEKVWEQAALIDVSPDAIMVRTLDDDITFWNKGAERIYGLTAEEAIGKKTSVLFFPDKPGKFDEANSRLLRDGSWEGEIQIKREDGRVQLFQSRWLIVDDWKMGGRYVFVVNTDITERKELESQFLRAERMQSIGTLAGGIAHDLNNVLAPIVMSIQILRRRVKDQSLQELLETIETSAKRGAGIVRQVLSYSRGFESEKKPIQVKHLLYEFEQLIERVFPPTITLKISSVKDPWTVSADPTQLYQVLMNLCVNARDAMVDGGMLRLELENVLLDERNAKQHLDARPGKYVRLSVSDTGDGIPAHLVDRIFEPFFTTKEIGKGTGLGLSTVLGIVKGHGGFVTVESVPRKGTTFHVFLPALVAATMQVDGTTEPAYPNGDGHCVLVVDDEPAVRHVHKTVLESQGFDVLTAGDGTEAVAVYKHHRRKVALVITDMMMPRMDGMATIRELRRINPKLKFIVASGLVDENRIAELSSFDRIPFLQKPYSAERLLETVFTMLNLN